MYSSKVLKHLDSPSNSGDMPDADACGKADNPVCGDIMNLYIKVEGDRITKASFQVQGCPPSIAAGSALTEMITGITISDARELKPADVTTELGSLPRNKEHCSVLAIDALRDALAQLEQDVL